VKALQLEAAEKQELHTTEMALKETVSGVVCRVFVACLVSNDSFSQSFQKISELQSSNGVLHALIDEERIASNRLQSEVKRLVPNATAAERHQKEAAAYKAKLTSKAEELALLTKENTNLKVQVTNANENSNIKQERMTHLMKIVKQLEASDDKEDDEKIIDLLSSDDEADEGEVGAGNTAIKLTNIPTMPLGTVHKHGATLVSGLAQAGARRSRRKSKAPVQFDPCRQEVRRPKEEPEDSSKKTHARARVGRKSRNQNNEGPSREVKSASNRSDEVKFGDVGYLFKRYFPEYTQVSIAWA
jgi:hypothetical protein